MNPWDLSASDLLIWGLVLHLIADWPLQNDWMAQKKGSLRHPAGYVHAGIHGCLLTFVFGWGAVPLAIIHLLIDTRKPVIWWSKLIGQSQPQGLTGWATNPENQFSSRAEEAFMQVALYDVGMEVRFWTDQVFHIICIAIAALIIA